MLQGGMQGHPRHLRIIYTASYTDWVFTLITTYQLPLAAMPCVTGNAHLVGVSLRESIFNFA